MKTANAGADDHSRRSHRRECAPRATSRAIASDDQAATAAIDAVIANEPADHAFSVPPRSRWSAPNADGLPDSRRGPLRDVNRSERTHDAAPDCIAPEGAARRPVRTPIIDEACRLAGDDTDREEMRIIREQLADLAPPLLD